MAGQLVQGKAVGTFLVRKNDHVFKLSWLDNNARQIHQPISMKNGFYVHPHTPQQKFSTIRKFVKFYQRLEPSDKYSISTPLINQDQSERPAKPDNQTQPGSPGSTHQPYSPDKTDLQGKDEEEETITLERVRECLLSKPIEKMTTKQAEDILCQKPSGSWILRLNEKEEERISVTKGDRKVHIKIYHRDQGMSLKAKDPPEHLSVLIHRLMERGTLKKRMFN